MTHQTKLQSKTSRYFSRYFPRSRRKGHGCRMDLTERNTGLFTSH